LYLRPAVPVCQHLELMGPNEMQMARLSAIVVEKAELLQR